MAAFDAGSGIEFMAVARLSDGVVLASKAFASPTAYDFAGRVGQIAAAPALLTMIDQHGMVADGDHNLCLAFLDKPAYLLAAVISPDFPAKRRVLPSGTAPGQRLLSELAVAVQGTAGASLATAGPGGLNRALQPHFKQLYAKCVPCGATGLLRSTRHPPPPLPLCAADTWTPTRVGTSWALCRRRWGRCGRRWCPTWTKC